MRTHVASLICLTALLACNGSTPTDAVGASAAAPQGQAVDAPKGENCDVSLEGPGTAKAGEPTYATLSLKAKGDWKVNQEAPLKVRVSSQDAEVPTTKLGLEEASMLADKEVRMEVPFTPHTEGPASIEVHANFGVCDNVNCDLCKEHREVETLVN